MTTTLLFSFAADAAIAFGAFAPRFINWKVLSAIAVGSKVNENTMVKAVVGRWKFYRHVGPSLPLSPVVYRQIPSYMLTGHSVRK